MTTRLFLLLRSVRRCVRGELIPGCDGLVRPANAPCTAMTPTTVDEVMMDGGDEAETS